MVYVSACKPSEIVESLLKIRTSYGMLLCPHPSCLLCAYDHYKTKALKP